MIHSLINNLRKISLSRWYWWLLITGGTSALAIALSYQHILDEQPCVLCIHVRLWITLLVMVSVIGLLNRNKRLLNSMLHLAIVPIAAALTERSYQLLGTERGFVYGECNFDLGLPAWFPVQEWLPWAYRVETSCGYTPKLLFNITMAEALIVMSAGLLIASLIIALASFRKG